MLRSTGHNHLQYFRSGEGPALSALQQDEEGTKQSFQDTHFKEEHSTTPEKDCKVDSGGAESGQDMFEHVTSDPDVQQAASSRPEFLVEKS